jgi:hypothetical protein
MQIMAANIRVERRLKRWHKTGRFCPGCRARRGGRAR